METCSLWKRYQLSSEEKPVSSDGWNFVESDISTNLARPTISMHGGK